MLMISERIITACIRRIGEGTVFSLSVHTSIGGGLLHLADGGRGVYPSQVKMGRPIMLMEGGTPISDLDG